MFCEIREVEPEQELYHGLRVSLGEAQSCISMLSDHPSK
jgi:hypothetical protein